MPFLRGSLSFERFNVSNFEATIIDEQHIEVLQEHVIGKNEFSSEEQVQVGFLGGDHLFDDRFDYGKNVINDAIHAGLRVDTNQVPSAIKNAWLQMEIAAIAKDCTNGKLSKAQRQEAKEAVEARCEAEVATGKYRKMSAFSWLWDVQRSVLYFGGSGGASAQCADLLERAFEVEVRRLTAGAIAQTWATNSDRYNEMDDCLPSSFVEGHAFSQLPWTNEHSQAPDFLGNEFLLWLWWYLENQSDTISLGEEGEVTAMMAKTLTLECPLAENGKETISSEMPTKLPEAKRAIQSGKLPRKSGLSLVREGMKFDLVLQAETFAISGAKISSMDDEPMEIEDRINAIRFLGDTVDGMFHTFCDLRTSDSWDADHEKIRKWLERPSKRSKQAA